VNVGLQTVEAALTTVEVDDSCRKNTSPNVKRQNDTETDTDTSRFISDSEASSRLSCLDSSVRKAKTCQVINDSGPKKEGKKDRSRK